jgi:hypothetical protein
LRVIPSIEISPLGDHRRSFPGLTASEARECLDDDGLATPFCDYRTNIRNSVLARFKLKTTA